MSTATELCTIERGPGNAGYIVTFPGGKRVKARTIYDHLRLHKDTWRQRTLHSLDPAHLLAPKAPNRRAFTPARNWREVLDGLAEYQPETRAVRPVPGWGWAA